MAFLSIFPNTKGFSVVITKEHYPSHYSDMSEEVFAGLFLATRKVAKILDKKFEDVSKTGIIMEGFGVDHAHTKLFPMHGTSGSWKKRISKLKDSSQYFKKYEGYISSHDYKRANDEELKKLAKELT